MATQQVTVDLLLKKLSCAGRLSARKMFGEYCLYLNDKPVGLVCDDTLYIKITEPGRLLFPNSTEAPPYPGAKPHFLFASENWKKPATLVRLLQATYDELPAPKPKRPRKPKA